MPSQILWQNFLKSLKNRPRRRTSQNRRYQSLAPAAVEKLEERALLVGDTISEALLVNPPNGGEYAYDGVIGDNNYGANDVDLFKVRLIKGFNLTIDIDAQYNDNGQQTTNTLDSYLRVFNASGAELASDDDSGDGLDSEIFFVVPATADYYIGVSSYNNRSYNPLVLGSASNGNSTGNYRLELRLTSGRSPEVTVSGPSGFGLDNQNYSYSWTATDPDGNLSTVTARLMRGTEEVRSSTATSGSLSLLKGDGLGSYHLEVTARDALGHETKRTTGALTINDDDTGAPVISLSGSSGTESRALPQSFSWSAVDATSGIGAVSVFVTNLSSGQTVYGPASVAATGSFNFDHFGPGTYRITVNATDADNDRAGDALTSTVTRTVTTVNNLPAVEVGPNQVAREGEVVQFAASATDSDGDNLLYTWDFGDGTIISGASLLSPTHTYLDNGVYTVRLSVSDGWSAPVQDTLLVTVQNKAPRILEVNTSGPVAIGDTAVIHVVASDAADDTLTFEFDLDNDGTYEFVTTGLRSGETVIAEATATFSFENVHPVNIRVADDDGAVVNAFTAIVVGTGTASGPLVNFATENLSVVESDGAVLFRAVLSEPQLSANAWIPVTVSGTVANGVDYTIAQQYLLFAAGATEATLEIQLTDDLSDEDLETLTLTLGEPINARLGSEVSRTITIVDNDEPPAVAFTSRTQTAPEGVGVISISAALSEVSGRDVVIPIALAGTASALSDYTAPPLQIVIPAGRLLGSVQVPIVDDQIPESNETILLSMQSPTNATLSTVPGAPTVHTVVIPENDAPSVYWTSAYRRVSETAGAVTVTAELSAAYHQPVNVPFSLSGSAAVGSDYTITGSSLNFAVGQIRSSTTITVVDDIVAEGDEQIVLTMGTPSNGVRVGTTSRQVVEIGTNDSPAVSFTSAGQSVFESTASGGAASVTLTVQLSNPSASDVFVPYSVYSSQAGPSEFGPASGQILVRAGFPTGSTVIQIANDSHNEPNEQVVFQLGSPLPQSTRLGNIQRHTVTILDDDPTVTLVTSGSTPTISENGGTVTLTARLSAPTNKVVTVPISLTGTARNGTDYTISATSFVILAGHTTATVTIQGRNDTVPVYEAPESIIVTLGAPVNAVSGSVRQQTITVTDDDRPTVSFAGSSYQTFRFFGSSRTVQGGAARIDTAEVNRTIRVNVALSNAAVADVVVPITLSGTAAAPYSSWADYTISGATGSFLTYYVTIPAGQTSATVNVGIVDDRFREPDQQIVMTMGRPRNADLGGQRQYTINILANDQPASVVTGSGSSNVYVPPTTAGSLSGLASGGTPVAVSGSNQTVVALGPTNSSGVGPATPYTIALDIPANGNGTNGPISDGLIFFDANKNGILDFLDLNGNGLQEDGEPSEVFAYTTADGSFSLSIPEDFDRDASGAIEAHEGQLVLIGGADAATLGSLDIPLTAPVGFWAVTPVTTIVSELVNHQNQNPAAAMDRVLAAFELPAVDLTQFNVVGGVLNGDPDAAALFVAGAKIQNTVIQVAQFVAGVPDAPPAPTIARMVVADLAAKIVDPDASLDLSNALVVQTVVEGVLARAGGLTVSADLIAGAASVIAAGNEHLDNIPFSGDAAFMDAVARVKVVARGQIATQLNELPSDPASLNAFIASSTGEAFDAALAAATVGNVVPPRVIIFDTQVIEGAAGETTWMEFTVGLTAASTVPVSVDYHVQDGGGTALVGSDHEAASGSLHWDAGDNSVRTIRVAVTGDDDLESNETLSVQLSNVVNASLLGDLGIGTIINDDAFRYEAPSDADNDLELRIDDLNVTLIRNADVVFAGVIPAGQPIVLAAAAGVANSLRIDLQSGPSAVGEIRFEGTGANDSLVILNDSARSVTHQIAAADRGSFQVDSTRVEYSGVPQVMDSFGMQITGWPDLASEGAEMTLSAGLRDPDAAGVSTYRWEAENAVGSQAQGTGAEFRFTPADNGTYSVILTAEIPDGPILQTIYSLAVVNTPPVPAITDVPTAVQEGDLIRLESGVEDAGLLDTHSYRWSVTRDGSAYELPEGTVVDTAAFEFVPADRGTYEVSLVVTDNDGDMGTAVQTIEVANAAPTIGVDLISVTAGEGALAENTGRFADPGHDPVTLSASIGEVQSHSDGTWTWSFQTTDGPDEDQTVTITATDADGGQASTSFSLFVSNVAPTLTLSGADSTMEGSVYTLTLSASDPGDDSIVSWTVNWGDGTLTTISAADLATANGQLTHVYADGTSSYTILASATDEDGTWKAQAVGTNVRAALDPTFGTNGEIIQNLDGFTADVIRSAVVVQPDGKILVAGYTSGGGQRLALARYHRDGSLDSSFGNQGTVLTGLGSSAAAETVLLDAAGNILVGGSFGLARFTADGQLDTSFGEGGRLSTFTGIRKAVLDSDGRILVSNGYRFARFLPNGAFDLTFGEQGVSAYLGHAWEDFLIDAAGRIVTLEHVYKSDPLNRRDAVVRRFDSNARQLDTGFGTSGRLTIDVGLSEYLSQIVLQDGKVLLGGFAEELAPHPTQANSVILVRRDLLLARLANDGQGLDSSFGTSGVVRFRHNADSGNTHDYFYGMSVDHAGRIVASGSYGLHRFLANGQLDVAFGTNGVANRVVQPWSGSFIVFDRTNIYLAGQFYQGLEGSNFAVQRFLEDGTSDPAFDNTPDHSAHFVQTGFSGPLGDYLQHVIGRQADGRILVAGYSQGGTTEALLARYLPDGQPDAEFGDGGIVRTGINATVSAATVAANGTIYISTGSYLYRLTSDGAHDTSHTDNGFSNGVRHAQGMYIRTLAVDSSGRLLAGGSLHQPLRRPDGSYDTSRYSEDLVVARFSPDGVPDGTYGDVSTMFGQQLGMIAIDLGSTDTIQGTQSLSAMTLDATGRVIGVGYTYLRDRSSYQNSEHQALIVRLDESGQPDATFNSDGPIPGVLTTTGNNNVNTANVVDLDSEGRLVVGFGSVLHRYLPDGTQDTTFGEGGAVTDLYYMHSLVIDSQDRIVAAGHNNLQRLKADGRLDEEFGPNGRIYVGNRSVSAIRLDENDQVIAAGSAYTGSATGYDYWLARYITGSLAVTVHNVAPQNVTISGPSSASEGDTIRLVAAATDPAGDHDPLTYSWTIYRNGSVYLQTSGTNISFAVPDNGDYSAYLYVTDGDGGYGYGYYGLTVSNIAPTGELSVPSEPVTEGDSVSVSVVSVADVSAVDEAAGFEFAFDFGNGFGPFTSDNSATFTPTDDGAYLVTARIRDKDGGIREYSAEIPVRNAAPTVTVLGLPNDPVYEGGSVALTAVVNDAGADDTHRWQWVVTQDGREYAEGSQPDFRFSPDNDGTYLVSVTVTDDDGGEVTAMEQIVVSNVAPEFSNLTINPVIVEGSVATISGSITDAGTRDSFRLLIDWGDGSDLDQDGELGEWFSYAAGTIGFQQDHRYLNNARPSGSYVVTATLFDSDGASHSLTTEISVENDSPAFDVGRDEILLPPAAGQFARTIEFADAGTLDRHTATVDFGDGSPIRTYELPAGQRSFDLVHTYVDSGTFNVQVTLTDDDGATRVGTFEVRVILNTAPTAHAGGPYTLTEGSGLRLNAGQSTDAENNIRHYAWDLNNDGLFDDAEGIEPDLSWLNLSSAGISDDGHYTVSVRVEDVFGESSTASTSITVQNAAPSTQITGVPTFAIAEGSLIELGSHVVDANDTHTYHWTVTKNGELFAAGDEPGFSFTPDDDGRYVVTLTVTDDDGGIGSDTAVIDVLNANPVPRFDLVSQPRQEGTAISIGATATDAAGTNDTLTYHYQVFSDGSLYAGQTGLDSPDFQFVPDNDGDYEIVLTVTDEDGGSGTVRETIRVENVAPTLTVGSASVVATEGEAAFNSGTWFDPGTDAVTLTASVGTVIAHGDGTWSWEFNTLDGPDDSQQVSISATDSSGAVTTVSFNLTVENAAPVTRDATFAIDENAQDGTLVGQVEADDPGADILRYSITGGSGAAAFAVNPTTGEITVANSALLDFETTAVFTLEVTVSDEDGASAVSHVTIQLLNRPSLHGSVFVDLDGDGRRDLLEPGIEDVRIQLLNSDGTVLVETSTDARGRYTFSDVTAGTYRIRELQPSGVRDGMEQVGSAGGIVVSNDLLQVTLQQTDATGYNFAELGRTLGRGDSAGIGFWQNRHGQELITRGGNALTVWLTDNFRNVFGNTFAGATGADVAAFYRNELFRQKNKGNSGPSKVDAQFMATALNVYFTNRNLAGNIAASYGFNVTDTGIGTAVVNVADCDDRSRRINITVLQILRLTNALTDPFGRRESFTSIFDVNGNGSIESAENRLRSWASDIYSDINEAGDL